MSVFAPDYVTVIIDGVDRTDFVINYHRYDSICELGQEFTLSMSPDMPDTLSPYQDVIITETYNGDSGNVLRGYIISFNKDFTTSNWTIQGHDKSILLFDYFVGEQVFSNGENVDFWIQYFADLVGLDLEFQATASSQSIVPDETPLGMQHAGDAILSLERIAGYFTKYDSIIDKLVTYRLGSSEPVLTISSALEATREIGTEKTRNVVKVYGGYRFNPDDLGTTQIFAKARSNIPELLVDKTVVIANPNLNRQTYAFIVAHRLLNVVNSLDDVQFYTLPGFYPDLQVGQVVYINLPNNYYIQYEGDRYITSIEAQLDPSGATTIIGIGDKCPRISIQLPVPPVYATTEQDGVAVSFDGGDNFKPSNIGLTGNSGYMDGRSIAVNSFGQQMVVTASGLFRRASSLAAWINISANLGNPVNDAGDDPPFSVPFTASGIEVIRVADETTHRNIFHLLANSGTDPERCWVYTTRNFGNTWASKELTVEEDFTATGIDMEADISNRAYVLVKGLESTLESYYYIRANPPGSFAGYVVSGIANDSLSFSNTIGSQVLTHRLYSLPNNREICYIVSRTISGSPEKIRIIVTKDAGETWTNIYQANVGTSIAPYTNGILIDPASGGGSGFSRIALLGTRIVGVPITGGTRTDIYATVSLYTHEIGPNTIVETYSETKVHALFTYENLFDAYSWERVAFGSSLIGINKYSITRRTSGNNLGKWGVILDNALTDQGPAQIPPYDSALYDVLHAVIVSYNFTTEALGLSDDIIFSPEFGFIYGGGSKNAKGTFSSTVTTVSSDNEATTFINETVSPNSRLSWYKDSSIIFGGLNPAYGSGGGLPRATLLSAAVDILTKTSDSTREYLDPDGSISSSVTYLGTPITVPTSVFWYKGIYYWPFGTGSFPTFTISLKKSSKTSRIILEDSDIEDVVFTNTTPSQYEPRL